MPDSPTPLRLRVAFASDPGRVRPRNEDAVGADPESGLLVVADGMGGHPAGDRASALAVQEVFDGLAGYGGGDASLRVEGAMRAAHRRILDEGDRDPALRGMGTTLTVLMVDPRQRRWVVGHVGDSRAYLFRGGRLRQITRDQTWVQDQVEQGHLDPERASRHPMANLLLQAIGNGTFVVPEVHTDVLLPGDLFLLCTDGLVRVVDDATVARLLESMTPEGDGELDRVARELVALTHRGGAPDNVTVALLRAG